MGEMPSTACCVSARSDVHQQQRVLLFGLVRCGDLKGLDSVGNYQKFVDQGFEHGRAQMFKRHQKQHQEKLHQQLDRQLVSLDVSDPKLLSQEFLSQEFLSREFLVQSNQRKNYQDSDDLNDYFTSLRGGTSSQTSDGYRFGHHSAVFGEGLYDETI